MEAFKHIQSIDVDRQKLDAITFHLNMFWDDTQNIPIKSLNKNGKAIQDKMETYLENGKNFYSSSDLKEVIKSPFHFQYYREEGLKDEVDKWKKKSEAFALGTFLHSAILEPSIFDKMKPAPSFNTASHDGVDGLIKWWANSILNIEGKDRLNEIEDGLDKSLKAGKIDESKVAGKKFIAQYYQDKADFPVIPEEYYAICEVVKKWYFSYGGGLLPRILKHSKREISIYDDKNFDLPVKVRPDAMVFEENAGKNIIVSVKSTNSPYPNKFFMDYASYEYPVSDGMYKEVASMVTQRNFDTTLCVMVQNTAPYGVGVFLVKEEDMNVGVDKFYTALATAKECIETGLYPGFEALAERGDMGISTINLPAWYYNQLPLIDLHR